MRSGVASTFALLVLGLLCPRAGLAADMDALVETLASEGDAEARVKAGLELAQKDPKALYEAVEKIVKGKSEADTEILARIAVNTKVAQPRWLLVWAAGRLGGAGEQFRNLIDNDHPYQSERAIEALGLLHDTDSIERLMVLLRSDLEMIAVAAARALGKMDNKRLAQEIVPIALTIDNDHVRDHLVWTVQDLLGSRKAAGGLYNRHARKRGTEGFRAKQALGLIDDETGEVEKYKVKLDTIRGYFKGKRGPRMPSVDAPSDKVEIIKRVLERMKDDAPDYYYLLASTVKEIKLSGDEQIMHHDTHVLNLRHRDVVNWNKDELWAYYIIRYARIMFDGQMGEPKDKQRGWEQGCLAAWQYAMDHAYEAIAVKEDPVEFIHGIISMRPPPW